MSVIPVKRNPYEDPRKGDRLSKMTHGGIRYASRKVLGVTVGGYVSYVTEMGITRSCHLNTWREWCRCGAKVCGEDSEKMDNSVDKKKAGMTWNQLREVFQSSQKICMRLTEENNQLFAENRSLKTKLKKMEEQLNADANGDKTDRTGKGANRAEPGGSEEGTPVSDTGSAG